MRRDGEGNLLEVIGNNNSFTIIIVHKRINKSNTLFYISTNSQ